MNTPYTTATNLFFAHVGREKVIGVTGTKGKSTSASLLAHILTQAGWPVQLVGNIGVPSLKIVCDLHRSGKKMDTQWFVYELSSYQLADCHFSPHIALVTSLFPEHMDYHQSEAGYYAAKHNIIQLQNENDYFVYDDCNQKLEEWAKRSIGKTIPFVAYDRKNTSLLGRHNKRNIEGVVTVSRILGVDDSIVASALISFQPLSHRLQLVGTFGDITFYDDAISTTPESTIAALEALPKTKTLFLGGLDRGYDFTQLVATIKEQGIQNIVLFPQSGEKIGVQLKAIKADCHIFKTSSMREAVAFAYKHTPKGSICLLSTASPSYTLWKNYEEKGDAYQLAVRTFYAT
jgi:UDP-N-acetylmuramoyl-L-alanine---L-glutamate ligase